MQELADMAAILGLTLTGRELDQFAQLEDLLRDWNQRMNLTAIHEQAEIRRRHFLDALSCVLVTGDLSGQAVVDIGTGAGFPGLPLKIHFPQMQLTLVESVHKKTRFLAEVVRQLALDDVIILTERAETVGQDPAHRERYDWAVARSVAAMPVLAEYLLPLCRIGGRALAQKGAGVADEVETARSAFSKLGGGQPNIHPVHLPGREQAHYLVVLLKERHTPNHYPRRPGIPAKRPL
jgi:16S rRNA (guanine527-N7)-methyltransferase